MYVDSLVDGSIRSCTMVIARGKAYDFRDDWDSTWKEYVTRLCSLIGKRPHGSVPFRAAWAIGFILEKILNLLNIRSSLTRLNAGVLGRDNAVDTNLARAEPGWKTTVSYHEVMDTIGAGVREQYAGRS